MRTRPNYTKEAEEAIHIAESYAKESLSSAIFPAHLFKAILHKDIGLKDFINQLKSDYFYLIEWADARMSLHPKNPKPHLQLELDDKTVAVLDEADNFRLKLVKDRLDPVCILIALCTPGIGFSFEQLKSLPLTSNQILDFLQTNLPAGNDTANKQTSSSKPVNQSSVLFNYTQDKLLIAKAGLLPPVVGMDSEVLSIFEILGRKTKSNVLIIGDAGVGKTSLINGLVHRINQQKVPNALINSNVFELDSGNLMAGANYKGELEDRVKKIIEEVKSFDAAILIIESFDGYADKNSALNAALSIIKQELKKGEVTVIATCSIDGFTKNIDSDQELKRNFEYVKLEEPDTEKSYRIIKEVMPDYENHHGIKISNQVITEAIRLAKRYLNSRRLPDAAIDLLDRSMSLVKTTNEITVSEIDDILDKLKLLHSNISEGSRSDIGEELGWIWEETNNRLSKSILDRYENQSDLAAFETITEKHAFISEMLTKLRKLAEEQHDCIELSDLTVIVARLAELPIGKVQTKERDKLINAEEIIKRRVVGQDHAIKTLIEAVYESRSGLKKKGQPIGSFFFLGPTGTGKTELAKSLAEFLFEDENSMIRFDMSEFKEEHSAALLYGAPPGYVGYEEGGLLVNKIRQKPYSVVLFDEIEKAHKSVFDIFLQILDEGKLHDRLGKVGDFSNALIIFTSNIGSEFVFKSFQEKKIPSSNELLDIMTNYFRPEFLGRLTEIIPFAPISEDIVSIIFDIHLKSLLKSLEELEITLEIEPEAKKKLAHSGYNAQYGARPIIGVIRNEIRRPLSKLIIAGKLQKGSKVKLKYEHDTFDWFF